MFRTKTPSGAPKEDFPYWLLVAVGIAVFLLFQIATNDIYSQVMATVSRGIGLTVFVTLVAFFCASLLGLLLALASLSGSIVLRQTARFYVEIVRGMPIIVLLLYIAFVATPLFIAAVNAVLEPLGLDLLRTRDFPLLWRAVLALTIGYSAFIAEVFRAGIQAVDKGQIEAAEALGMNGWLRFRLIIFPQALKTILPPLGNDFVALIKDSSLVSVLGVADITQLGKVYAAGSFRYFETYNVVALIYLMMTITLSLALRKFERTKQIQER
ncbi:Amino acid ABC transporter, permease protein, 3-TM region, His/Glu/Gln/Arg/opine [Stappia aggregata IAM 12614]|uniref:Amino acid ABC transporter, permease protein, 3-TM region, His/Glu/Gln/Arg/opine n=1 Tax=Roseibium aggregatum (strain ATCC 25650 / DSM 13394 / JCM 20685 / NBRC 16684 / NCIMB 2208 / IAM 12614 / B1) TaxID=384765 RepID=A0NVC3_ROSAI|nr:amino acid ABC transporter permease [Roseibium aggregatum]EAV43390.1 Amino acid ABC transporter, permease protein, 3-TM region, His/Glu/Gln/Arg/opine [Stappia aggregata IAM 12614] [Roseibium aggregatum IAM 12614]